MIADSARDFCFLQGKNLVEKQFTEDRRGVWPFLVVPLYCNGLFGFINSSRSWKKCRNPMVSTEVKDLKIFFRRFFGSPSF